MSIRFEKENHLAIVTIDRPETMNALDMAPVSYTHLTLPTILLV